jgi:hypothetical protein
MILVQLCSLAGVRENYEVCSDFCTILYLEFYEVPVRQYQVLSYVSFELS